MKVVRVLGSRRMYEFEDGELVPFDDMAKYKQKMKASKTVTVEDVIKVLDVKPKRFTKKKKGAKK